MKWICLLLASWCTVAVAAPEKVSLAFRDVRPLDLLRVVYTDVLHESYVVEPGVGDGMAVVSVDLRGFSVPEVRRQVAALLTASGVYSRQVAGVAVFSRQAGIEAGKEDETYVYRLKHRTATFVTDLVSNLVPGITWASRRVVAAAPGMQGGAGGQQNPNQVQQPKAVDTGTSAFSAIDKLPDLLVMKGSKSDLVKVKQLLAQVDVPVPELSVRAVLYEVTTTQNEGSAVGLAASLLSGKLGVSITPTFKGDNSVTFSSGGIQAVFQALNADSRFHQISAPSVRVRSGSEARVSVGADTPILGAATTSANGAITQSVEYKPTGVQLNIKPDVRDEVSELTITQTISEAVATSTGVNGTPTFTKREISSVVGVRDGDVVLLGGMEEAIDQKGRSGLPFLPAFLQANTAGKTKTEVLLVLNVQRI